MEWIIFSFLIVGLLVLDLVVQRHSHKITLKEASLWSLFWIAISLIFNAFIYLAYGSTTALQFFTGYLLEKSLSIDNIFIFVVIFSYFKIDPKYQHRVLYFGVIGALVMRLLFIMLGTWLLQEFHFVIYLLAILLIITGFRLLFMHQVFEPEKSVLVKLFKKIIPVTHEEGGEFFVKKRGKWMATHLMLALVAIEVVDLFFAIDSLPAIFAITLDPFIVYTSNIFAILGLRSLYFVLRASIDKLYYLRTSLAVILIFIGVKMGISYFYPIPLRITLGFILLSLAVGAFASLLRKQPPAL